MLQAIHQNETNAVPPQKAKATRKKASGKKLDAKAPAALSKKTRDALKHLEPLPVHGPDSELIATYNSFLLEWKNYKIDAETNPEADVTPCDAIACKIVEMSAHTAEGMLLKINAAASVVGETKIEFPWGGEDFQFDTSGHCSAGQIEYVLIDKLRDDIRRFQQPKQTTGVSGDLAALLRIWGPLDRAALHAMMQADINPRDDALDAEMENAIAAEKSVRYAIIHTPAKSLEDIAAKFRVQKQYADDAEDWQALMRERINFTEGTLWSICGDLLSLPDVPITVREDANCAISAIADKFRHTIGRFDAVESADGSRPRDINTKLLLEDIRNREQFLITAASHERACSIKGALFQLTVVSSMVDQAINSTEWRKLFGQENDGPYNPPPVVAGLERDIYRLLFSGIQAIAHACGIPEKEFAGDYFLNIDPFKGLEG